MSETFYWLLVLRHFGHLVEAQLKVCVDWIE